MDNKDFVNSTNFANHSDVVYSQIIKTENFKTQIYSDVSIIDKNKNYIFYRLNKFKLRSNDIIFCNALMLECLFKDLKKLKKVKNLKLIISQSDRNINKSVLKNLPSAVSECYSINLSTKGPKLNSLPLGIANDYSPKNLLSKDFEYPPFKQGYKESKLYINFNELTNTKHRKNLKDFFNEFEWAVVRESLIPIDQYREDLQKFRFVLCPWGNGVDTHRIWEALYLGSIPIIKRHETFKCLNGLPVIFVDNYEEINIKFLEQKFSELDTQNNNYEYLKINFWIDQINLNKVDDKHEEIVICDDINLKMFSFKRKIKTKSYSFYKKLRFRVYQINKKLNKFMNFK